MNRTIIRIICPHPERIEITFEDGTVLVPGQSGISCYFAEPGQTEWLAPPEKAGQLLSEAECREILALEPILRGDKHNPIVFLYDGELYRAAAALAKAVHERKLWFWFAKRRLRKAFPILPKGIPDSVLRLAYFDTR